jgi:hypothetical protein
MRFFDVTYIRNGFENKHVSLCRTGVVEPSSDAVYIPVIFNIHILHYRLFSMLKYVCNIWM